MTGLTLGDTQSDLPSPNPTHSYWHREPRLQGHRTTEELPETAGAVVIGAGITGAFAARFLVEKGVDVVLLEAREVGWGATGRVSFIPSTSCVSASFEHLGIQGVRIGGERYIYISFRGVHGQVEK